MAAAIMKHSGDDILAVLDRCCEAFTFPMLDNGYLYLAATRMALFRSAADWAMTIEVFGFSPRAGIPHLHIHTFASALINREVDSNFASDEAYRQYLATNPSNSSRFLYPIDDGPWLDAEDGELVAEGATEVVIRGQAVGLPAAADYETLGIELEEAPRVAVFELCRALAATHREQLLATDDELRGNLGPEMKEILRLDEWHHPDVVTEERPSGTSSFQELAEVLVTGDVSRYTAKEPPNTHWENWPDGGTL